MSTAHSNQDLKQQGFLASEISQSKNFGLDNYMSCDNSSFRKIYLFSRVTPPFYDFSFRRKFFPRRSRTAATIKGKAISASLITIVLSAFCFNFPQLIVSSIVEPERPPGSGLSVVIITA
jgi:hypothetical protein